MKQKLMIHDFDGVYNPLNFVEKYIGPKEIPDEMDYIFRNKQDWEFYREPVSGPDFFTYDHEDKVVNVDTNRAYNVQWSSEFVKKVNKAVALPHVRSVMLTTWKRSSVEAMNPLMGLNIHEWIPPTSRSGDEYFTNSHDINQFGKAIALKVWLEKEYGDNVPDIVWVDDVATGPYIEGRLNLREFLETDSALLLVKPTGSYGTSRSEWDQVVEFLES